eukprot:403352888
MQKKGQVEQQPIIEAPKIDPRKYIVAGNWKSNGTVSFVREMINEVLNKMRFDDKKVEVIVAPMIIHIPSAKAMLNSNIQISAQNICQNGNGPYTGEVSAEQVKDFGLNWVIVGHSERRQLFNESNEIIAKKVERAQEQGLSTIICIGDSLEERERGETNDVIKLQLDAIKDVVKDWSKIVIAYEPVWTIGTGRNISSQVAEEIHQLIRQWVVQNVNETVAQQTRVIFGGSVNEKNAESFISQKNIDGFLIDNASLKMAFGEIVDQVNKAPL